MVLSLQHFIAFAGNNESSSQPDVIYIIDFIAISHLFVWASEALLWKSYITLSALPEQFDSSKGDKKGCTSSHFNTVCDELCSSSRVFVKDSHWLKQPVERVMGEMYVLPK